MDSEAVHNEYLQKYIDPILEKMVVELLMKKPTDDLIEFMRSWLQTKGTEIMKENVQSTQKANAYGDISDDENDSEMEDDVEDLLELQKKKKGNNMRVSVSAEAYGEFNKKGTFQARVIAKSEEAKQRIKQRMDQAFMFSGLDDKETQVVIDSFEEKCFKAGQSIIT